MPLHKLDGCAPVPLAHYLKALGILRVVSEQADPTARGKWDGDVFVLETVLEREALERFFLDGYRPAPIVAPWNGGSGFNPKDNREAIDAIMAGHSGRYDGLRRAIEAAREARRTLGMTDKAEDKGMKEALLRACRAQLPDEALPWFDAAVVLTQTDPKFPPLLGTGGNDGRLDFTNNFMQRLLDLIDPGTGHATVDAALWLDGALYGMAVPGLRSGKAIGQFLPMAAGGANARPGFSSDSLINPWDFVLMLEGALMFAGSATKRLGDTAGGALAYPFTARQVGAGYGSSAESDEKDSRAELWLPLWELAASAREIQALFGEGRVQVNRRVAATGLDFARAVATLGVARGIGAFERYGFQVRNGLSYFATPLGRFRVQRNQPVALLNDIDDWLGAFRRATTSDGAPASARKAARQLEDAIFTLCQTTGKDPAKVQDVLVALGHCERMLVRSKKWAKDANLRPVPLLDSRWLVEAYDQSCEFRLAASLATMDDATVGSIRHQLEPVELVGERVAWSPHDSPGVVWAEGDLIATMIDVASRRLIEQNLREKRGESGARSDVFPGRCQRKARLEDVSAFIDGRIDDRRFKELFEAFTLVKWSRSDSFGESEERVRFPYLPAAYALTKLCFIPGSITSPRHSGASFVGIRVPAVPELLRQLASGRAQDASATARRRLRGSGVPPIIQDASVSHDKARRIAAALLFDVNATPLAHRVLDLEALAGDVRANQAEGVTP